MGQTQSGSKFCNLQHTFLGEGESLFLTFYYNRGNHSAKHQMRGNVLTHIGIPCLWVSILVSVRYSHSKGAIQIRSAAWGRGGISLRPSCTVFPIKIPPKLLLALNRSWEWDAVRTLGDGIGFKSRHGKYSGLLTSCLVSPLPATSHFLQHFTSEEQGIAIKSTNGG